MAQQFSVIPQPMEGLHDQGPPPFLTKTYDIVEDPMTNHIVSWSIGSNSFVVWDPQTFSMSLLPRYFKHSNFSSFVRQLNTYGFRKVDPDRWEFANEGFLRGQKNLLKNIRRRKTPESQASDVCVEVGSSGYDGEIDILRRDKQILMMELVKLRQQQQNTIAYLQTMEEKLQRTELKQQQMMNFLARAMQNPNFIQQLVQQNDTRKELEEVITRKRRRPIEQGSSYVAAGGIGHGEPEAFVKFEPQDYSDISGFGVPELEQFDIGIHGLGKNRNVPQASGSGNRELDKVFWDDLMKEGIEGGMSILRVECESEDDVGMLVDHLGQLGSCPK